MTENDRSTATREDAYRLLAACYYPPTPALFEEDSCAALAALLEAMTPDAAQYAANAAVAANKGTLEALAVEHARLFVGPFQLVAPPYASIYLDDAKTVMGDSTARVAAFYHACDLHLADDFYELPDHVAVELEFMSYLAFKEREAEIFGAQDEVTRFVSLQREFLDRFLLPWLEPFTSSIIREDATPFYQAVARCTVAFIHADHAALTCTKNA